MRFWMTLPFALLVSSSASALGVNHPFSATAVQQLPGQPERQARIFVTADKVRMEFPTGQGVRAEITDLATGTAYVLLTLQQVYMQRQATPAVLSQWRQASGQFTPCVAQPQAVCNKLGDETLFGRPVEKWEMVIEHQARSYRSLYWIDTERFMPLRQLLADGTVTELKSVGREMRGSRDTEKWYLETRRPDGQAYTAMQWYDTKLQIMIAEVIPGGYRRELQDIVVAPQDAALFSVPAGYRQVTVEDPDPRAALQQHLSE